MSSEHWDALERAILLAMNSHQGQRDKAGKPYILHLLQVMNNVEDPVAKQAAVLHDYIEDVGGTAEELTRNRINPAAIEAILKLTRPDESTYCDYVIALSQNPIANQVKRADLEDNYRLGRVAYRPEHTQEDAQRIQRYALSYQYLTQAIDENEYRNRMMNLE